MNALFILALLVAGSLAEVQKRQVFYGGYPAYGLASYGGYGLGSYGYGYPAYGGYHFIGKRSTDETTRAKRQVFYGGYPAYGYGVGSYGYGLGSYGYGFPAYGGLVYGK